METNSYIGKLNFGNLEIVQGHFNYPVMKVTNLINGESGYLMPFRNSFFQISGNKEGVMDMGSGDAIYENLKRLVTSADPIYNFKIEVCKCLNSYLNTTYGDLKENAGFVFNNQPWLTESMKTLTIPSRIGAGHQAFDEFFNLEDIPQIDEFINEAIKSIANYYNLNVKVS